MRPASGPGEAAQDGRCVAVSFDFTQLAASDISGRARAFGSLVKGGMPMAEAAAVSGILIDDDEGEG